MEPSQTPKFPPAAPPWLISIFLMQSIKNIIRKTTKPHVYVVNHNMLFKGDYTKFINDKVNIKALFSDTSSLKENFNNEKVFYANKYLSSTIPIDHMIAAIGIFIGLVLNLNVYAVIILARICTLAFYIVFLSALFSYFTTSFPLVNLYLPKILFF